MNLSPVAQATLLLTSYFSRQSEDEVKPLSNVEWGRFALWLKQQSATPADLLSSGADVMLAAWIDPHITRERIETLLSRGHSLALAVERWQRAGLWVLTRSEAEYPRRLKQQLRTDAPPVLLGCGDITLLNQPGCAVSSSSISATIRWRGSFCSVYTSALRSASVPYRILYAPRPKLAFSFCSIDHSQSESSKQVKFSNFLN